MLDEIINHVTTDYVPYVSNDEGYKMKKEMLVNVYQPEESRIAILEDGTLEELYVERNSQENYTGNIYKGRVVNIEPSIQAAFVDFGVGRNGFLHVSDLEYEYYKHLVPDKKADVKGKTRHNERNMRSKPPIQDILRRGSEVLVQVIKEGIGNKGPTLSTYISIPGRYLVLMPGLQRVGVSRKIEDEDVRKKLKRSLLDLNPPPGLGFIIRTAGVGRSQGDLRRDMKYLLRLWQTIVRRIKKTAAPVDIYEENDMMIRTIRDIFSSEIDTVWIDEEAAYNRARDFMKVVMPKHVDRIRRHEGKEPLFHKHHIEEEITRIQNRHVPLSGGGSIVIDQTEALVAIDVNSGSFRVDNNAEKTAYQVNLKAAEEIARQIRLRDLGGVIVNDFIDMRDERHRRSVEKTLRNAVERDRARTKVLRISPFGLIEMTRQRIRPSLRRNFYEECPCCHGTGYVKTAESLAVDVMRLLMAAASQKDIRGITVCVTEPVANYLNNRKRREIAALEERMEVNIDVDIYSGANPEHINLRCLDEIGKEIKNITTDRSKSKF